MLERIPEESTMRPKPMVALRPWRRGLELAPSDDHHCLTAHELRERRSSGVRISELPSRPTVYAEASSSLATAPSLPRKTPSISELCGAFDSWTAA